MDVEKFKKDILAKSDFDYGICPPPIDAQEGLNILINHFLGEDWYVTLPLCQRQVNAEAVYQILKSYPKKRTIKDLFKRKGIK